jgi:SAM-dependent methyltransferase
VTITQQGSGRDALRRLSFLFQDGIVLCTTLRGLDAIDLLEPSLAREEPVSQLCPAMTETGFAHVRVGLRSLAQAGWIVPTATMSPAATTIHWTPAGRAALAQRESQLALGAYLATFCGGGPETWTAPWDEDRIARFAELVELAAARWPADDPPDEFVAAQLDGALLAPALLWLDATDRLRGAGPDLPAGEHGAQLGRLLTALGWLGEDGSWTADGACGLDFVDHLGLAGSYLPTFARLPELYGGELATTAGDDRWHVQRELNIRASTAAHARYFADADPLLATVFDREPLAAQPSFVLDSSCGDGAWLAHIHAFVRDRTMRGRHLEEHPLRMVGADVDEAAAARARLTLAAAGADALVVRGETGAPEALRDTLAGHDLDIADALHVHAFADHDRPCCPATGLAAGPAMSSGAYLDDTGRALDPADVEADLAMHFARWAPHVARHGLVVLEAHCVAPLVTLRHQGALHSIAFDAYSGYSRQYPVERRALIAALRRAGLVQAATGEKRYPTTRPFVAVSVNHLRDGSGRVELPGGDADAVAAARAQDTWRPDPGADLLDGEGLHRLLYDDGDLRHPRGWSAAPTSLMITQAMEELEALLSRRARGDVLRVLDYGTGTGLAATELLKACHERGFDARLQRAGVALEVHLVDIPGSWFARGYEILSGCSWTRFHSMIGADGRFRPLGEVTGGLQMDVILSSMVFHLIKPRAFERVVDGLGELSKPGGRLLWSTPDVGPAGPFAVLFHDPNRALRAHWKALVAGDAEPRTELQRDAVAVARRARDGAPLIADDRADKRILKDANTRDGLGQMLSARFTGAITTQAHEIADRETLDTLLVPSNQGEYLPEIEVQEVREAVIAELLNGDVLPALHASPAGTALGYDVHWTFGDFRRLDD